MTDAVWIPALTLADLAIGESRVIAHGRRRIALFRPEEDQLYAVDDQCPHEGYPLARGSVRDCVVTCPWHNFKFDLRDGQCVLGDEQVRVYPIRIRDGAVELDVRDPDPSLLIPRHLASLEGAVREGKLGQIARELVRLLQLGMRPEQLAEAAMRLDAAHAEYGTTHATPTAIDGLHLARRAAGVQAALPLVHAFAVAAEANLRLPQRIVADPVDPGDDPIAAGERLRALVEEESLGPAEALLRGAIARGWGPDIVDGWLLRLCSDHLLGFGHPLIYAVKLFGFFDRHGWDRADDLLPALLARTISSTRAELIPKEHWFRQHLAQIEAELASFAGAGWRADAPATDRNALCAAILDGGRDEWMTLLCAELRRGVDPKSIADALVLAASERALRFDITVDRDASVQEGWLDVTHRLTFASAVRQALQRRQDPLLLRLLFQAAHFIHTAAPLDLPPAARFAPHSPPSDDVDRDLIELDAAIRRHDAAAALDLADGLLGAAERAGEEASDDAASITGRLEAALEALTVDDLAIRPIFAAHWIKLCVASFAEMRALPAGAGRRRPVLACVRFFAGPIREQRLSGLVHDAIRFVVDGKVPKTLT